MDSKVPLWAFAVVGICSVFFLYQYINARFEETSAYEEEAYTGLYIDSTKPPTVISSSEQQRIDEWIKKNNLNQYGDSKKTVYKEGPLKKDGGQSKYTNRFQYILAQHPDRPWNVGSPEAEQQQIDQWVKAKGLNQFGDPADTAYTGGTPLFDERTGKTIDRYDYIRTKHPDKPWSTTPTSAQ